MVGQREKYPCDGWFAPGLEGREPWDWTAPEARRNADWMIDITEERAAAVLDYLGVDRVSDHESTLRRVDARLTQEAPRDDFTFLVPDDGPHGNLCGITSCGRRLALDAGLLVVSLLQERHPDLFHIMAKIKTRKNDAYLNASVLTTAEWNKDDWRQFAVNHMSEVQLIRLATSGPNEMSGFFWLYGEMRQRAGVDR